MSFETDSLKFETDSLKEYIAPCIIKIKPCPHCGVNYPVSDFYFDHTGKMGRDSRCKYCTSIQQSIYAKKNADKCTENQARRRARKLNAMVPWSTNKELRQFFKIARRLGYSVDHIVPLDSDYVCGLHWVGNFSALSKSKNSSKRNFYWQCMPDYLYEKYKNRSDMPGIIPNIIPSIYVPPDIYGPYTSIEGQIW